MKAGDPEVQVDLGSPAVLNPVASAFAIVTSLLGAVVLLGYAARIEVFKSLVPGGIVMLPMAAVCFLLGGLSLWLQLRSPHRIGRILGGIVAVLGASMLFQRLSGITFPATSWLFHDTIAAYPYRPLGVIASNSSFCVAVLGIGLTLLERPRPKLLKPHEALGIVAALVSFVALLGYVYDVSPLYKLDRQAAMALPTAIGLVSLSIGLLASRPWEGAVSLLVGTRPSAMLTRRLLATTAILPVVLGRIWLEFRRQDIVSREVGVSFFVVAVVTVFLAVIFWTANALRKSESVQEAALREAQAARKSAVAARESAEHANQVKSEFLAVMSHELRTPLNAIRGYAELLQMEIPGPLTPEQKSQIERIRRSEQQLLGLIDDVLSFTRIDAGHLEYRMAAITVVSILERLNVLIEPLIRKKDLRFENTFDMESRIQVHADPDRAVQILVNLLMNAVKFTHPAGKITLSCEVRNQNGTPMVAVGVSDTGRGIPPDKIGIIFEPFIQVDGGLTRTSDGVGLGLAISRSLARDMNGEIEVASEEGHGSTFTLILPLSDETAHAG